MAAESEFVALAHEIGNNILDLNQYQIKRGEPLLYQVMVGSDLRVMNQDCIRNPQRGNSAFQTDLCILEKKLVREKNAGGELAEVEIFIPRVVLEFKTKITTHDILTYSAKARKHKQIYPYLRYGLIASEENGVPGRLFTHNEFLDFCATVSGLSRPQLKALLEFLLHKEVEVSHRLEEVGFGRVGLKSRLFRTDPVFDLPPEIAEILEAT